MTQEIKVGVSILASDFGKLADEAKRIEDAGADSIHIDIMDGHFVPNFSLGEKAVAAINRSTDLFLDVHLMIYNPFDYIERFIQAGADGITFHFEATEDVAYTLEFIKKASKKAGLSFNPETSPSFVSKYLPLSDLILIMGVHPGFAGQKFIEGTLEKLQLARSEIGKREIDLQIDGGMDLKNAEKAIQAGSNYIVSGSYLYSLPTLSEGIEKIKNIGK